MYDVYACHQLRAHQQYAGRALLSVGERNHVVVIASFWPGTPFEMGHDRNCLLLLPDLRIFQLDITTIPGGAETRAHSNAHDPFSAREFSFADYRSGVFYGSSDAKI